MVTIAAKEIKRRGMSAVDDALRDGPVHIIKNDEPTYVVVTEAHYRELVEAQEIATIQRVREALAEVAAGRVRRGTAAELIAELNEDG